MALHLRNPRQRKLHFGSGGRERQGELFEGEEYLDDFLNYNPAQPLQSIKPLMQEATQSLRLSLEANRVDNPILIYHANIYERAVLGLAHALETTQLPQPLRDSSLRELILISTGLNHLFSGRLRTKIMNEGNGIVTLEGYFEHPADEAKRLIVRSRPDYSYSDTAQKWARPNTQIFIKDVLDQTIDGRVIGSDDISWRVGLRYGGDTYDQWVVSIDAGAKDLRERRWRTIYPLSQAIEAAKIKSNPTLNIDNSPYTYHYYTPRMTSNRESGFAINRFTLFSIALMEILRIRARERPI